MTGMKTSFRCSGLSARYWLSDETVVGVHKSMTLGEMRRDRPSGCFCLEPRLSSRPAGMKLRDSRRFGSTDHEQKVIGTINWPQTAARRRRDQNESLRIPWPRPHHISSCMR
jgi:hypothetical protein